MQVPLDITFRGMEPSPAVDDAIRKHAARLERFHPSVTACHVTVESPHRHHHKGQVYTVRVNAVVPHSEVAVTREPGLDHAHEDVYVAMRDAFNAVARRLEDVLRKPRAERHPHEPRQTARVVRLFPEEGYGFVEMPDSLEVYFHKNSVLDGKFKHLKPGDNVRVVVAETGGERGPRASTVDILG